MSDSYLRFWGVRGSYPAPFETHLRTGGNTSCVEVRVGDEVLVCDAGTGIIPLGNELISAGARRHLTVLLTHYHWDHISGLPFFVPAFVPGWRLKFFGPGETHLDIEQHISDQMKAPYFPVETETWLADISYLEPDDDGLQIGPIHVDHFNVHHPGSTYGYTIETCGKRIVYASDNELAFIDQSIDDRKQEFDEREQRMLEDMRREERSRALEFMQGVDILIHDAQYTPEDYQKKRGWGHSCYIDTVNCAIDAGVKSLYLFHLDPNYSDVAVERMHAHALSLVAARGSPMQCLIAREGDVVPLD